MILWTLLSVSLVLTIWVGFNIRGWPRPAAGKEVPHTPLPLVSVLVPARNEERGIVPCLESLLTQTHPNLEVLCLNDRSEDGTGKLLEKLQQRYPEKLKVLEGRELPEGWVVKRSWKRL